MSIRIGFVDFRLENYHANVFLKAFRARLAERGAIVAGCFALDADDGRNWAKKNSVPWFDSAEVLNRQVDAFMVLAPSNPELHLKLCEQVFSFAKPTYVDKTFAPDLATARRIFALADRFHTPVQTTSALRYTAAQKFLRDHPDEPIRHMTAWGGGSSFAEYAIHPIELIVSCMGVDAISLMRRGNGEHSQLLINFSRNRTATANVDVAGDTPFMAVMTTAKQTRSLTLSLDEIFIDNAAAVLDLFETNKPNIDRQETLMIRRILDVAEEAKALEGFIPL